jgi:hypothetical protein
VNRKEGLHAAVVGWGKCLPPAVLSNADLATFLETDDEWIVSRTGMKERRVSHVSLGALAVVAASRALACAGLDAAARQAPGAPPGVSCAAPSAPSPRRGSR